MAEENKHLYQTSTIEHQFRFRYYLRMVSSKHFWHICRVESDVRVFLSLDLPVGFSKQFRNSPEKPPNMKVYCAVQLFSTKQKG